MKRGHFWLIWLVGAGPLVLAMWMYFSGLNPAQGTQRGQLLPAGGHLADWYGREALRTGDGGQPWRVLLTFPAACQQHCQRWQRQLPKVQQALGKDRQRMQWQTVTLFQQIDGQPLPAGVWLADPHGNLVLRYQFTQPAADLLKDLRRLLKVSRIG